MAGLPWLGASARRMLRGIDGLVEELAEEGLELAGDSLGEVGAVVEHGEDDAFDEEAGVEGLADALDGVEQFADAFQGEVLGLHGDEDGVGGDQGVEGEQVERGRTVEDDDLELVANGLQGVAEAVLAEFGVDQLDVGSDEVLGGGDDFEVRRVRWAGGARRRRRRP